MSTDTSTPRSAGMHRKCWDLLPWFVTGRLGDAERRLVEGHLPGCAECRVELEAQRQLHDDVAREDPIAYSPAASFEKLWSRIEELEREVPVPVERRQHAHQLSPGPRKRTGISAETRETRLVRWLVAAVVLQAIAIGWLASTMTPSWPYRTVTSSFAVLEGAPRYRIVFAPQVSVTELQRVLAAHGLVIVQTAPGSEIFTVSFDPAHAQADAASVLESLRAESSVRFVELMPRPAQP